MTRSNLPDRAIVSKISNVKVPRRIKGQTQGFLKHHGGVNRGISKLVDANDLMRCVGADGARDVQRAVGAERDPFRIINGAGKCIEDSLGAVWRYAPDAVSRHFRDIDVFRGVNSQTLWL